MSARKGNNLKQVKYQLKSLEEAFERDATVRHKNISVRSALIIAQECVDKQIGKKPIKSENQVVRYVNTYYCPTCELGITGTNIAKWCYHCGQKIDWSDVD